MDRLEVPSCPLVPFSVMPAMSVVDGRGNSGACCKTFVDELFLESATLSLLSSTSLMDSGGGDG